MCVSLGLSVIGYVFAAIDVGASKRRCVHGHLLHDHWRKKRSPISYHQNMSANFTVSVALPHQPDRRHLGSFQHSQSQCSSPFLRCYHLMRQRGGPYHQQRFPPARSTQVHHCLERQCGYVRRWLSYLLSRIRPG